MRTVTVGGVSVAFEDSGEGQPVVLLHGSGPGASAEGNWAATVPSLVARGYRVIAPDVVGFGRSGHPVDFRYDAVGWADNLEGLLDALGLDRVHLVGNSMGGRIALHLAHRGRAASVTVMGVRSYQAELSRGLQRVRGFDGTRAGMRALFEEEFVVDRRLVTDAMVDRRFELATAPGEMEHYRHMFSHPHANELGLTEEQLRSLEQPVLVVHGREDRVVPMADGLALAAVIPDCVCVIVPNCGHWVQAEQPERFVAQVDLFLSAA